MRPEHQALATELVGIFRKSLQDYPSAADCSGWWQRNCAVEKARRFLELNTQAAADVRGSQFRAAVVNDPSLVHIFWLLDLDAASVAKYVDLLLDTCVSRSFPHTKFWARYSRAIAIFCGMAVTLEPKPKPVGYERFWEPYLDYMAGSISHEEFTARATASFAARNRQSRSIDWESLDGDAGNPVKWDIRYASIMRRAELGAPPKGGPRCLRRSVKQ